MSDNIKPKKCCEMGSYECQVPMPINGRRREIDYCIADIVAALNAANIITVASCCGHGQVDANIILDDGRTIQIPKHCVVRFWEPKSYVIPPEPIMPENEKVKEYEL